MPKSQKKTATQVANEQTKKALKWLIRSGALLTLLTATSQLLTALQNGEINVVQFVRDIFFIVAFACINGLIYWVHEYGQAKK